LARHCIECQQRELLGWHLEFYNDWRTKRTKACFPDQRRNELITVTYAELADCCNGGKL
jgi:hypothetical protein